MPFTNADYLPSFEELEAPDINLSSAPLRAGALHFGIYCDNVCKEFMLCSSEEKDPRKCFKEGKDVSKCAIEFFRKVKGSCAEEFTRYWQCLDMKSNDLQYRYCRDARFVFDDCIKEKLGQDRAKHGHFSKTRVHHTNRARPEHNLPLPEAVANPPDVDNVPTPESAKFGPRVGFFG